MPPAFDVSTIVVSSVLSRAARMMRLPTHCTSGGTRHHSLAQRPRGFFELLRRHEMIEDAPCVGALGIELAGVGELERPSRARPSSADSTSRRSR